MQAENVISLDSVVTVAPEQVSCELSGEVVVLSLKNGEYFGLNPVAATVWSLIQSSRTVAELRDRLLQEFSGITPDECLQELTRLLTELRDLELVTVT